MTLTELRSDFDWILGEPLAGERVIRATGLGLTFQIGRVTSADGVITLHLEEVDV